MPNRNVIAQLNRLLASERAAEGQYTAHLGTVDFWRYVKQVDAIKARREAEREHIDELTQRIMQLGGTLDASTTDDLHVGATVPAQLDFDQQSEQTAIDLYSAAIPVAVEADDETTADLLRHIRAEEVEHLAYLDTQRVQLDQMGEEQFLGTLV
jgi:bacterioferritin